MPFFSITGAELDFPRNLALLDTNVLVAFAYDGDGLHYEAVDFIDNQEEFVLGVAPPVIAEACGLLIGRFKRQDRAEWLLRWLLTPGTNVRLLPAPHGVEEAAMQDFLNAGSAWMRQHQLDYVDAFLMQMADQITVTCTLQPDLVIVTSDLRDFRRCYGKGYAYRVHDISNGETV